MVSRSSRWLGMFGICFAAATARADMAAYRAAVQGTPGLVDYFDFEGDLDDSADGGNGLNSGTAPTPAFDAGVNGQGDAAVFSGADSVMTITRSIQDDYTIMGWVLAPEVQRNDGANFWQGSGLVYADVGGAANDFGVAINGTKLTNGVGNPDTTLTSTTEIAGPAICGWYHLAAVRRVEGGVSQLEIYVNGQLDAQGVAPNVAALTASGTISVGANAIDGRFYLGSLDELALFGEALDSETISDLFDAADYSIESGECPPPDAACDNLLVEGPANDRVGTYNLTASGSDPVDSLRYTFTASRQGGPLLSQGPLDTPTASFAIAQAGTWTFSVHVEDDPCCPDGPDATCTVVREITGYGLTDASGRITGDAFLALGPFQQSFGANPGGNMLRNFIAPDRINCLYPRDGDTINYDTAQAASTGYAGPTGAGGAPMWRPFDDGSSFDGDQALETDTGATAFGNVVTWLATYVEYRGAAPVDATICLGSDDSGLLHVNREVVINSPAIRGRGDCDASATYTFTPGVYRLAAAAFQGGGGWGLRISLSVNGAPVLGDDPSWVFHGRTRPASFVPPDCGLCPPEPVTDLSCTLGRVGLGTGLILNWTNPAVTDPSTPTTIKVEGVTVLTVPSTATTASVPAANLPAPGTFFTAEVVHCGGVGASCSPYGTNAMGQILGGKFLVLGPFTHTHGCGGPASQLEGNHLAPSHIACQYPVAGDEIDYDPADPADASTGYVGPPGPTAKPVWRAFEDGSAADGDQDLSGDQGPLDDVMSWLVTYVEYKGPGTRNVTICLGHDDGGQVWFNDRLLLTRNVCQGRAECQSSVTVEVTPGVFRLAIAAWNDGGGWGAILSLQDADLVAPIVDDGTGTEWVFHGRQKPAAPFDCDIVAPVVITACQRTESGAVDLAWTHQEPVTTLTITANGNPVQELPGASTSVTIPAASLPAEDPLQICIQNGSQPAACCFVSPIPECLNHYTFDGHLDDELSGNNGTFSGGAEVDPTYVEGQDGAAIGAIRFDGADDSVVVARSVSMEFTLAFWVLSEQLGVGAPGEQFWQGSGLVYADVGGGNNDFGTALVGETFAFGIGNPDMTVHSTSPVVGPEVGWKHVAATRAIDQTLGQSVLSVYVDGVLENTLVHPNIAALTANANITIGGNTIDNRLFNGTLDDLFICNYPLTEEEIRDLMSSGPVTGQFHRGDSNNDDKHNISDPVNTLNVLFLGTGSISCQDAADSNDDGKVNISDPVNSLNVLFLGIGTVPPPAVPELGPCGPDPTLDEIDCAVYSSCA